MPHFCIDEAIALMALFPFIGYFFTKIHSWYHAKFNHKCHNESCDKTHVYHLDLTGYDKYMAENMMSASFSEAFENSRMEIICGWDSISESDVREKLGDYAVDNVINEFNLQNRQIDWLINYNNFIKFNIDGNTFVYDDCSNGVFENLSY